MANNANNRITVTTDKTYSPNKTIQYGYGRAGHFPPGEIDDFVHCLAYSKYISKELEIEPWFGSSISILSRETK
jgi:hypothetical protein